MRSFILAIGQLKCSTFFTSIPINQLLHYQFAFIDQLILVYIWCDVEDMLETFFFSSIDKVMGDFTLQGKLTQKFLELGHLLWTIEWMSRVLQVVLCVLGLKHEDFGLPALTVPVSLLLTLIAIFCVTLYRTMNTTGKILHGCERCVYLSRRSCQKDLSSRSFIL